MTSTRYLDPVVERERQQVACSGAHQSFRRGQDHANVRVVISKDLPVTSAGAFDAPAMIANSDDVRHGFRTCSTSSPECDQLRAGAAREVVQVHTHESTSVGRLDRRPHGVYAVLVRPCIRGSVDRRTRHLDEGKLNI